MITYNITPTAMKTLPSVGELSNVVVEVTFSITATNEDNITGNSVTGTLRLSSPKSDSFTSFESLTEAEVVSWIEAHSQFKFTRSKAVQELTKAITQQPVDTPLPWV